MYQWTSLLLRCPKRQFPIIFLKDVPFAELEYLIQYIYTGRVHIPEGPKFDSFTQLARSMGVSGTLINRNSTKII